MAVRVQMNPTVQIINRLGLRKGGRVQKFIDEECLRRCDPYTPKKDNYLIESGRTNTNIGQGKLIWETPYARRWYYMPASFTGAPIRGNYWFDRMKNNGGGTAIVSGANRLLKGGGTE